MHVGVAVVVILVVSGAAIDHYRRDCTPTTIQGSYLICFHYSQWGHKKAQCSSLVTRGQVIAPAPATLRITGCQGWAKAPAVRSRAFQLVTEETHAALDVAGA